jgi:hypothetical protein
MPAGITILRKDIGLTLIEALDERGTVSKKWKVLDGSIEVSMIVCLLVGAKTESQDSDTAGICCAETAEAENKRIRMLSILTVMNKKRFYQIVVNFSNKCPAPGQERISLK